MKRILITGGTGFIGSHICRRLLEENYLPVVPARHGSDISQLHDIAGRIELHTVELNDRPGIESLMENCDSLIHCAAMLSMNMSDQKSLFQTNVELTRQLMNVALESNMDRVIFISSIAAFGYHRSGNLITEEAGLGNEMPPGPYGESKFLAELEVRRAEAEGLDVVILNPSFVLGPGNWKKGTPFIFARLYNSNVPFYPAGRQGFVDVRDVAEAVVRSLSRDVMGQKIIISAENRSWKDIITLIRRAYGKKAPAREIPRWLISPAGMVGDIYSALTGRPVSFNSGLLRSFSHDRRFDNSKSEELLGMEYRAIEETVGELVKIFVNQSGVRQ